MLRKNRRQVTEGAEQMKGSICNFKELSEGLTELAFKQRQETEMCEHVGRTALGVLLYRSQLIWF